MYRERYSNKYGAKKAEYNGVQYHSKGEAAKAAELDLLLKAGEIKAVERQVWIPLVVNGVKICSYVVDFRVTHKDDSIELIEYKGFETETFRLKRKLFEATFLKFNPEIRYVIERQKSCASFGRLGGVKGFGITNPDW